MSHISIKKNKEIIANIDRVVSKYNDAINYINVDNSNSKTDSIISNIEKEISTLNKIKERIIVENNNIVYAMNHKPSKEESEVE